MRLVLIQKIILTRKVFPISTYTCNESEDTQTHHILVRAQKEQYCSGMTHLSVTQIVTSTPCWSALFSPISLRPRGTGRKERPRKATRRHSDRGHLYKDQIQCGEMGVVTRTGVDQNKGSCDLNQLNKARWCRDL